MSSVNWQVRGSLGPIAVARHQAIAGKEIMDDITQTRQIRLAARRSLILAG